MIDMFALTVALGGGAVVGMAKKAWDNRDISKVKNVWKDTLLKCNIQGIRIKVKEGQDKTFLLLDVKRTENGFKAHSLIPRGLDYEALINAKRTLESNLNAKLEIDKDPFCKWINISITTNRPDIKYKKINCSSDYLFGGYYLDGKPNLINLNVDAHVLWTGTTGTGKTIGLFMALTNLISNRKKYKNFQLYFAQIVNRETSLFADCPGVNGFANNLVAAEKMLKRIMKIKEARANLLESTGCKDINQYNKYNPDNIQDRIIFCTEEFSFFKVGPADDKETEKLKLSCERMLLEIVKAGRSNNINLLTVLQRPTVTNLDTTIRSQLSVITFKLRSENDSKIAIQDKGAEKLRTREAIFDSRAGIKNLIYPVIDDELDDLRKLVPQIRKPNTNIKKVTVNNSRLSYEETQELKNRAKKEHLHVNEEYKKLQDNKVVPDNPTTNGLYDKPILKFIEIFGGITIKQCSQMFYHNKNNAGRRLKELENKGKLKSYIYSDKGKEKVYVDANDTSKITHHEILINNFYSQLVEEGAEILEVNRHPHILQDKRRPDLYVRYTHNNHEEKVYLEVDYTHFTDDIKIFDYDALWKKTKDFKLIVMRDGKFITKYTGEMEITHIQTKKYSIFNA